MRRWWYGMVACPTCGEGIYAAVDDTRGKCGKCDLHWSQDGNITVWQGADAVVAQRMLPFEWIIGRKSKGLKKALFLGKMVLWNLIKLGGFPIRYLMQRRLATFQRRSLVDRGLAEHWRSHYLKGLEIPPINALMFEYSYRKLEKVGFAGLLGFRIAIQDVRRHAWWGEYPLACFQLVPAAARHLPFKDGLVDIAFTDGVIFDMERQSLNAFFRECLRILKPGGYLLVWGGNSLSRSRAKSEIRWHGRIHSLEDVRTAVKGAGFAEVDVSFEGYSPPFFATVINMIRHALSPLRFKTYDYDSWLARWQRPERRAYWLLRLVKPVVGSTPDMT